MRWYLRRDQKYNLRVFYSKIVFLFNLYNLLISAGVAPESGLWLGSSGWLMVSRVSGYFVMGTFSSIHFFFLFFAFFFLAFGLTCAKHTVATQRTYHRVVDLSCVSLAVTGRGGTWHRSEYYPRCRPRRCYYLWRPHCSIRADPSGFRWPPAMLRSRPAGWPSMFPMSWPHYPAGEGTERTVGGMGFAVTVSVSVSGLSGNGYGFGFGVFFGFFFGFFFF